MSNNLIYRLFYSLALSGNFHPTSWAIFTVFFFSSHTYHSTQNSSFISNSQKNLLLLNNKICRFFNFIHFIPYFIWQFFSNIMLVYIPLCFVEAFLLLSTLLFPARYLRLSLVSFVRSYFLACAWSSILSFPLLDLLFHLS